MHQEHDVGELFRQQLAGAGVRSDDQVNSPAHYKGSGQFEAIDVIESFGLGYRLGNVVKYILRADKKGKRLQDLKKAAWYLAREISKTEGSA